MTTEIAEPDPPIAEAVSSVMSEKVKPLPRLTVPNV
jgi:hypothetical protein